MAAGGFCRAHPVVTLVEEVVLLSYPVLCYLILCYSILSYSIRSYPILSYPIIFYAMLSYAILSYRILSYPSLSVSVWVKVLHVHLSHFPDTPLMLFVRRGWDYSWAMPP